MKKRDSQENISIETVKRISSVAKLELSSKELKGMQKDLNNILLAFKELDKVNTKNIEPSFHPIPIKDVFREDAPEQSLNQEKALMNTKHKEKGFFKGPRVV